MIQHQCRKTGPARDGFPVLLRTCKTRQQAYNSLFRHDMKIQRMPPLFPHLRSRKTIRLPGQRPAGLQESMIFPITPPSCGDIRQIKSLDRSPELQDIQVMHRQGIDIKDQSTKKPDILRNRLMPPCVPVVPKHLLFFHLAIKPL